MGYVLSIGLDSHGRQCAAALPRARGDTARQDAAAPNPTQGTFTSVRAPDRDNERCTGRVKTQSERH